MVLRRFSFGLVMTVLLAAPISASGGVTEDCRAMHATKRKTALERWRGPRSNANKYPLYCENERILATVPGLLNIQLGNLGGGTMGNMAGMGRSSVTPSTGGH